MFEDPANQPPDFPQKTCPPGAPVRVQVRHRTSSLHAGGNYVTHLILSPTPPSPRNERTRSRQRFGKVNSAVMEIQVGRRNCTRIHKTMGEKYNGPGNAAPGLAIKFRDIRVRDVLGNVDDFRRTAPLTLPCTNRRPRPSPFAWPIVSVTA